MYIITITKKSDNGKNKTNKPKSYQANGVSVPELVKNNFLQDKNAKKITIERQANDYDKSTFSDRNIRNADYTHHTR